MTLRRGALLGACVVASVFSGCLTTPASETGWTKRNMAAAVDSPTCSLES